jgi:hypothetical protein
MGKFKVGDRSKAIFSEDAWLDNTHFKNQYPSKYNIVRKKSATVATVLRIMCSRVSDKIFDRV